MEGNTNMKGNIIEAWYDEPDEWIDIDGNIVSYPGETHLYKETKYGTFYGHVKVSEKDKDIANSWDGYRFAEMKCDIQAYKAKANIMKERANGITHALKVVLNGNPDLANDPAIDKLLRQEIVAWKNYYRAKEQYEVMRDSYSGFCDVVIKQRREFRNKK